MNFYKKAMMADGGRMPQYGQGGKMPEYAEGGEMEGDAKKLQMLKAAYEKAQDENNEKMVKKIEEVLADMIASTESQEAKEMIMEMFPGIAGGEQEEREEPRMQQMMAAGGYMKEKKYPGGGYFRMK